MQIARAAAVGLVSIALLAASNTARALFGNDPCLRVTLAVNNDFGRRVEVERFRMHSASEGRWLNEDFRNVVVPIGQQNFVVGADVTIEYADNDLIDRIEIVFRWLDGGRWVSERRLDRDIAVQKCTAERTYVATIRR